MHRKPETRRKSGSAALAAFTLLYSLATPSSVSAVPARPQELLKPATSPVRNIRVFLGVYRKIAITGTDLRLNGMELAGSGAFNVRCETDGSGNAMVVTGAGVSSRERLEILSPGGFLKAEGKLFRSRLSVIARGSQCALVNTLDLEKYLAGLINREMSPHWPLEAMKAQAVASRSYAIFQARANQSRDFDVESTTQDQVYDGADSETPKSNKAAEETRGLVLSFDQQPIKAYFHANCGGRTELPVAVWGNGNPAFRPVYCPYHRRPRDRQRWSLTLTKEQIQRAMQKIAGALPGGRFLRVAHLEAGAPNPNQRLNDVVVSDVGGNNVIVSANAFRNAVGNTKVRSTAFQVREESGVFHIEGEGFGHGVGMCQVGARAMAEEGKTFSQILTHYYPLAKLKRL